jgi:hypothetical protein
MNNICVLFLSMMPMNNMPQPPQRFVSEQQQPPAPPPPPTTTITLVPSSSTIGGDDESVNDDQTSLSPSTDSQQKQSIMTQSENQLIGKLFSLQKPRSNVIIFFLSI